MSYFLPSFFQKRILRYALSRLELLDTDALDLEKLDIEWGRNSTVELRELGLHTKKLSALLDLPRSLVIASAQILYLRLTIPADLYRNRIRAEARGIRVCVNARFEEQEADQRAQTKAREARSKKHKKKVQSDKSRSNQSHIHDPGGSPSNHDIDPGCIEDDESGASIPSTIDLAKSFLQTEPHAERVELQASMPNAENLDLSQTNSDVGVGDEMSALGVGNDLSLPAFLANFLKGVGDRIEIAIQDVQIDIGVKIECPSGSTSSSDGSSRPEIFTFRFAVENISVDGVATLEGKPEVLGTTEAQSSIAQQTRRITVRNIEAMVILEASLFADLGRSTAPSLTKTKYRHKTSLPSSPSQSSKQDTSISDMDPEVLAQTQSNPKSVNFEGFCDHALVPEGRDNESPQPMPEESLINNSDEHEERPAQSVHSIEELPPNQTKACKDSETLSDSVAYRDLASSSGSSQSTTNSRDQRSGLLEPLNRDGKPPASSNIVAPSSAQGRIAQPHQLSASEARSNSGIHKDEDNSLGTSGHFHPSSEDSSPNLEDLAESRIFTHDEASMYMSAISHTSHERGDDRFSVPGTWTSDEPDHEREKTDSATAERTISTQQSISKVQTRNDMHESKILPGLSREEPIDPDVVLSQARPANDTILPSSQVAESASECYNTPPKWETSSSQESERSSADLKSRFNVVKRLISIDKVTIQIPMSSELPGSSANAQSERFEESSKRMPGGFGQASGVDNARTLSSRPLNPKLHQNPSIGAPYSVSVGKLQILGDIGLTRMLILISQQFNTLRTTSKPEAAGDRKTSNTSASQETELRLTVQSVSWSFVDAIKGVLVSETYSALAKPVTDPLAARSEVLLRADIMDLHATYGKKGPSATTRLSIGKFTFGYCSDNIISFDSGLKMRESTRDILAPINNDIAAIIRQSNGSLDFELTTLPLHVSLDLRRLDETFGWFGGFSSIVGLGNSMMSTMTVVETKSKGVRFAKPARGVHFESTPVTESQESNSLQAHNRVTARIGGLVFDLQGTQSTLRIEGTAMKMISRAEGLGLRVDRLTLSGPYAEQSADKASIQMKITGLFVEYLSTPKEVDLARLLALLSPSKDKDARDDDILLDTLLRQRRQGAVTRATIDSLEGDVSKLSDLHYFPLLAEDLKKLSTVTRYLPEDDRPGILTLMLIKSVRVAVTINSSFGVASLGCEHIEGAHVTFPSLMTLGINKVSLHRNDKENIVTAVLSAEADDELQLPMVTVRFIGNEMEPTAKVKLCNLLLEYHVSTIIDILDINAHSAEEMVAEMASSVTTVTSYRASNVVPPPISNRSSTSSEKSNSSPKTLTLDVMLRNSAIGLNPHESSAKGLVVLTDIHFLGARTGEEDASATVEISKASIMVIDDVRNLTSTTDEATKRARFDAQWSQSEALSKLGWVSIGAVSAAKVMVEIIQPKSEHRKMIDVEIRNNLFVIESCADSTQTLLSVLTGLKPPMPAPTERQYMTEVVPIEDMLASFTGNAFPMAQGNSEDGELPLEMDEGDMVDDEVPQNLEFVSSFYHPESDAVYDDIADSMLDNDLESLASPSIVREIGDKNLLKSFQDQAEIAPGNMPLHFLEDHFHADLGSNDRTRGRTNKRNSPGLNNDDNLQDIPLRIRVRDVHVIWNLFDGYDWQHTRDTISQAIEDLKLKAAERLSRKDKRKVLDREVEEEEEESVIGDFLFNSIYIGVPATRDPKELTRQVNRNVDDLVSESESNATSSSSSSPNRHSSVSRSKDRKLRLTRSRYHKMTFELKGVSADVIVLPPDSGETQSSVDIRIRDLEVFDHVPTSTWKKFATYMHDAGERESGASMIHLEILNVKPVPNLAASEIIIKATLLPLRLHVDQDALDFMTRFFEFKGDTASAPASKSASPFLQRVEVNAIQVKLDFKPKRVDYAGIRSGHTTEFMNFFILDRADMVLRHVIIYGVSGFDKLGKTLNDIWMPDVKRNQLPGILAGLAPVRSIANVGSGVRDLVVVPIREYQKDGRVVRSFQKGAVAFAKTTTSELVKLGAKLAIGTQTVLQGAEELLTQPASTQTDVSSGWEDAKLDDEERKRISLYADQPVGVVQGLRGAYASLERDLLTAKDAIIAMPGEILESGTASGAAKAVLKGAPTVILRPAMGVSKAVGQTLMGATNSLDPGNRRRIEDKYKRH